MKEADGGITEVVVSKLNDEGRIEVKRLGYWMM